MRPLRKRVPVAIFSLEMSKEQLVLRMLCSEAQVEGTRIRTGFLSESDWPKLTLAAGNLSDASIFIDDTPALTILELRAKARRLKGEHGLGMLIVDYLQLMRGRTMIESRQQEISEISRSLKALAKELNHPRDRGFSAQPEIGIKGGQEASDVRPPGIGGH